MTVMDKTINYKEIKINYSNNMIALRKNFPDIDHYQLEKLIEHSMCTNLMVSMDILLNWIKDMVAKFHSEIMEISLNELKNWNIDGKRIYHDTGKFFEIIGLNITSNFDREVSTNWSQPILKESNFDGGLLGLLRTYISGLPHYLIQLKFEPGNYGSLQLSPTLQATFSNINQAHGGRKPHYYELFRDYNQNDSAYKFKSWLAEDGGRLFKKRNLGLVKQVDYKNITIVDETYNWVSLYQIKKLMESDAIVNPHLARLIFL